MNLLCQYILRYWGFNLEFLNITRDKICYCDKIEQICPSSVTRTVNHPHRLLVQAQHP